MAATGSDIVLELHQLTVAYYRAPVVRDLTLTVGRGEVVALLGANGAGKTTTLRAISGLLKPAGGAIRLSGQDLAGVSPTARARLGLAHVPPDRGIFFGLTVAEHFRLDGTELDAAVGHFPALRPLGGRKAGLLSGGEQQMLAIARVLSRERRGSPGCAGRSPPAGGRSRPDGRASAPYPHRLGRRFRRPDQASVRRDGDSLHGLLRWHRETWMNSLRKDLVFSIRQLFGKQFKVTIA